MSLVLAVAVFAWSSGDALAQEKGTKDVAKEEVTRDDVAKYLGKMTPSEQKAAAKRARQLGLKPGVAGRAAQAPAPGGVALSKHERRKKMSKIKFLIFMSLVAALAALAPVAAFAPAPPLPGIEGPGGVPHYFGPYGNWAFSPLPRGPVAAVTVVDGGTGYTAPTVTIADAYITPTTPANVTAVSYGRRHYRLHDHQRRRRLCCSRCHHHGSYRAQARSPTRSSALLR